MVSASVHLYKMDEFKVYVDKFADEFVLTIETPHGVVNFMSNNLKDLEEITRKMRAVVQLYTAATQKKEIA